MTKIQAFDPAAEPEILTTNTYFEQTYNRTVFVKFFSPQCAQCVQLAPVWEALAKQIGKKRHGLIAAVDCSSEAGRELCVKWKIGHMPALLWGDPLNLEPYIGGPTFEELHRFARKNLKMFCSGNPYRRQKCTVEQNATIAEYEKLYEDGSLDKMIEEKEKILDDIGEKYTEEVEKLNDLANDFLQVKIKESGDRDGLILMKSEVGRRHLKSVLESYTKDENGVYVKKQSFEDSTNDLGKKDEL